MPVQDGGWYPVLTRWGGGLSGFGQGGRGTPALPEEWGVGVHFSESRIAPTLVVFTEKAPDLIGPYSPAVQSGDFVYLSGLGFGNVVQTRIYLVNMSDWNTVNRIYGSYFTDGYPALAIVQLVGLPKEAKVKIEMVAQKR